MLEASVGNDHTVVVCEVNKMVSVTATLTKPELAENVSCGGVSRADTGIPITSNDQNVPSRDAVDNVLKLLVEINHRFGSCVQRGSVDCD